MSKLFLKCCGIFRNKRGGNESDTEDEAEHEIANCSFQAPPVLQQPICSTVKILSGADETGIRVTVQTDKSEENTKVNLQNTVKDVEKSVEESDTKLPSLVADAGNQCDSKLTNGILMTANTKTVQTTTPKRKFPVISSIAPTPPMRIKRRKVYSKQEGGRKRKETTALHNAVEDHTNHQHLAIDEMKSILKAAVIASVIASVITSLLTVMALNYVLPKKIMNDSTKPIVVVINDIKIEDNDSLEQIRQWLSDETLKWTENFDIPYSKEIYEIPKKTPRYVEEIHSKLQKRGLSAHGPVIIHRVIYPSNSKTSHQHTTEMQMNRHSQVLPKSLNPVGKPGLNDITLKHESINRITKQEVEVFKESRQTVPTSLVSSNHLSTGQRKKYGTQTCEASQESLMRANSQFCDKVETLDEVAPLYRCNVRDTMLQDSSGWNPAMPHNQKQSEGTASNYMCVDPSYDVRTDKKTISLDEETIAAGVEEVMERDAKLQNLQPGMSTSLQCAKVELYKEPQNRVLTCQPDLLPHISAICLSLDKSALANGMSIYLLGFPSLQLPATERNKPLKQITTLLLSATSNAASEKYIDTAITCYVRDECKAGTLSTFNTICQIPKLEPKELFSQIFDDNPISRLLLTTVSLHDKCSEDRILSNAPQLTTCVVEPKYTKVILWSLYIATHNFECELVFKMCPVQFLLNYFAVLDENTLYCHNDIFISFWTWHCNNKIESFQQDYSMAVSGDELDAYKKTSLLAWACGTSVIQNLVSSSYFKSDSCSDIKILVPVSSSPLLSDRKPTITFNQLFNRSNIFYPLGFVFCETSDDLGCDKDVHRRDHLQIFILLKWKNDLLREQMLWDTLTYQPGDLSMCASSKLTSLHKQVWSAEVTAYTITLSSLHLKNNALGGPLKFDEDYKYQKVMTISQDHFHKIMKSSVYSQMIENELPAFYINRTILKTNLERIYHRIHRENSNMMFPSVTFVSDKCLRNHMPSYVIDSAAYEYIVNAEYGRSDILLSYPFTYSLESNCPITTRRTSFRTICLIVSDKKVIVVERHKNDVLMSRYWIFLGSKQIRSVQINCDMTLSKVDVDGYVNISVSYTLRMPKHLLPHDRSTSLANAVCEVSLIQQSPLSRLYQHSKTCSDLKCMPPFGYSHLVSQWDATKPTKQILNKITPFMCFRVHIPTKVNRIEVIRTSLEDGRKCHEFKYNVQKRIKWQNVPDGKETTLVYKEKRVELSVGPKWSIRAKLIVRDELSIRVECRKDICRQRLFTVVSRIHLHQQYIAYGSETKVISNHPAFPTSCLTEDLSKGHPRRIIKRKFLAVLCKCFRNKWTFRSAYIYDKKRTYNVYAESWNENILLDLDNNYQISKVNVEETVCKTLDDHHLTTMMATKVGFPWKLFKCLTPLNLPCYSTFVMEANYRGAAISLPYSAICRSGLDNIIALNEVQFASIYVVLYDTDIIFATRQDHQYDICLLTLRYLGCNATGNVRSSFDVSVSENGVDRYMVPFKVGAPYNLSLYNPPTSLSSTCKYSDIAFDAKLMQQCLPLQFHQAYKSCFALKFLHLPESSNLLSMWNPTDQSKRKLNKTIVPVYVLWYDVRREKTTACLETRRPPDISVSKMALESHQILSKHFVPNHVSFLVCIQRYDVRDEKKMTLLDVGMDCHGCDKDVHRKVHLQIFILSKWKNDLLREQMLWDTLTYQPGDLSMCASSKLISLHKQVWSAEVTAYAITLSSLHLKNNALGGPLKFDEDYKYQKDMTISQDHFHKIMKSSVYGQMIENELPAFYINRTILKIKVERIYHRIHRENSNMMFPSVTFVRDKCLRNHMPSYVTDSAAYEYIVNAEYGRSDILLSYPFTYSLESNCPITTRRTSFRTICLIVSDKKVIVVERHKNDVLMSRYWIFLGSKLIRSVQINCDMTLSKVDVDGYVNISVSYTLRIPKLLLPHDRSTSLANAVCEVSLIQQSPLSRLYQHSKTCSDLKRLPPFGYSHLVSQWDATKPTKQILNKITPFMCFRVHIPDKVNRIGVIRTSLEDGRKCHEFKYNVQERIKWQNVPDGKETTLVYKEKRVELSVGPKWSIRAKLIVRDELSIRVECRKDICRQRLFTVVSRIHLHQQYIAYGSETKVISNHPAIPTSCLTEDLSKGHPRRIIKRKFLAALYKSRRNKWTFRSAYIYDKKRTYNVYAESWNENILPDLDNNYQIPKVKAEETVCKTLDHYNLTTMMATKVGFPWKLFKCPTPLNLPCYSTFVMEANYRGAAISLPYSAICRSGLDNIIALNEVQFASIYVVLYDTDIIFATRKDHQYDIRLLTLRYLGCNATGNVQSSFDISVSENGVDRYMVPFKVGAPYNLSLYNLPTSLSSTCKYSDIAFDAKLMQQCLPLQFHQAYKSCFALKFLHLPESSDLLSMWNPTDQSKRKLNKTIVPVYVLWYDVRREKTTACLETRRPPDISVSKMALESHQILSKHFVPNHVSFLVCIQRYDVRDEKKMTLLDVGMDCHGCDKDVHRKVHLQIFILSKWKNDLLREQMLWDTLTYQPGDLSMCASSILISLHKQVWSAEVTAYAITLSSLHLKNNALGGPLKFDEDYKYQKDMTISQDHFHKIMKSSVYGQMIENELPAFYINRTILKIKVERIYHRIHRENSNMMFPSVTFPSDKCLRNHMPSYVIDSAAYEYIVNAEYGRSDILLSYPFTYSLESNCPITTRRTSFRTVCLIVSDKSVIVVERHKNDVLMSRYWIFLGSKQIRSVQINCDMTLSKVDFDGYVNISVSYTLRIPKLLLPHDRSTSLANAVCEVSLIQQSPLSRLYQHSKTCSDLKRLPPFGYSHLVSQWDATKPTKQILNKITPFMCFRVHIPDKVNRIEVIRTSLEDGRKCHELKYNVQKRIKWQNVPDGKETTLVYKEKRVELSVGPKWSIRVKLIVRDELSIRVECRKDIYRPRLFTVVSRIHLHQQYIAYGSETKVISNHPAILTSCLTEDLSKGHPRRIIKRKFLAALYKSRRNKWTFRSAYIYDKKRTYNVYAESWNENILPDLDNNYQIPKVKAEETVCKTLDHYNLTTMMATKVGFPWKLFKCPTPLNLPCYYNLQLLLQSTFVMEANDRGAAISLPYSAICRSGLDNIIALNEVQFASISVVLYDTDIIFATRKDHQYDIRLLTLRYLGCNATGNVQSSFDISVSENGVDRYMVPFKVGAPYNLSLYNPPMSLSSTCKYSDIAFDAKLMQQCLPLQFHQAYKSCFALKFLHLPESSNLLSMWNPTDQSKRKLNKTIVPVYVLWYDVRREKTTACLETRRPPDISVSKMALESHQILSKHFVPNHVSFLVCIQRYDVRDEKKMTLLDVGMDCHGCDKDVHRKVHLQIFILSKWKNDLLREQMLWDTLTYQPGDLSMCASSKLISLHKQVWSAEVTAYAITLSSLHLKNNALGGPLKFDEDYKYQKDMTSSQDHFHKIMKSSVYGQMIENELPAFYINRTILKIKVERIYHRIHRENSNMMFPSVTFVRDKCLRNHMPSYVIDSAAYEYIVNAEYGRSDILLSYPFTYSLEANCPITTRRTSFRTICLIVSDKKVIVVERHKNDVLMSRYWIFLGSKQIRSVQINCDMTLSKVDVDGYVNIFVSYTLRIPKLLLPHDRSTSLANAVCEVSLIQQSPLSRLYQHSKTCSDLKRMPPFGYSHLVSQWDATKPTKQILNKITPFMCFRVHIPDKVNRIEVIRTSLEDGIKCHEFKYNVLERIKWQNVPDGEETTLVYKEKRVELSVGHKWSIRVKLIVRGELSARVECRTDICRPRLFTVVSTIYLHQQYIAYGSETKVISNHFIWAEMRSIYVIVFKEKVTVLKWKSCHNIKYILPRLLRNSKTIRSIKAELNMLVCTNAIHKLARDNPIDSQLHILQHDVLSTLLCTPSNLYGAYKCIGIFVSQCRVLLIVSSMSHLFELSDAFSSKNAVGHSDFLTISLAEDIILALFENTPRRSELVIIFSRF